MCACILSLMTKTGIHYIFCNSFSVLWVYVGIFFFSFLWGNGRRFLPKGEITVKRDCSVQNGKFRTYAIVVEFNKGEKKTVIGASYVEIYFLK